jgi:hypothetical protein
MKTKRMEELLKRIMVDILEAVEDATEMGEDPLCSGSGPGSLVSRSRHRDPAEPVRRRPGWRGLRPLDGRNPPSRRR